MTKHNWKEIIQECESSGQTITQWCKEHQISTKTYYSNRNKMRKKENALIEIPTIVTAPPKREEKQPVAIVTIREMRIELFNTASEVFIKSFMEIIQNAV